MATAQEIKEAAEKCFPITDTSTFSGLMQDGFIEGAKWAFEQFKQSPSDAQKGERAIELLKRVFAAFGRLVKSPMSNELTLEIQEFIKKYDNQ
jgi:broad specificity phosphatase PhoE